jgi:hypothetical protein
MYIAYHEMARCASVVGGGYWRLRLPAAIWNAWQTGCEPPAMCAMLCCWRWTTSMMPTCPAWSDSARSHEIEAGFLIFMDEKKLHASGLALLL